MSIKRTIIVTAAIVASVAMVAPTFAGAVTVADLQAQINALLSQLQSLQGNTVSTATGACVGVTFSRNLTVGSRGSDVSCLQQILNVTPKSGYFGPITLAAVRAYQAEQGWTPANQVGPMTRAALNASLSRGGTTTTGLPVGCTVASGYSPVTGVSCAASINLPAGCTSTVGFSPVTGAPCATGVTTTQTGINTQGATGYLTVSGISASPASNASVTATSNVPVLGVDVRATGSDMIVTSAEVQLTAVKYAVAGEHPATSIKNLYVYDGSTLLGTFPVNTSTVLQSSSSSSTYYMILSGFRFVAPVNTTKSLLFTADFTPGLETNRVVTVNLYDQGLRAIDGAGASSNTTTLTGTTTVSGSTTTAATYSRQYTIAYGTVGTSTLTVSTDTSVLKSTSVNVNHTSGTTNVPMFVFQARSTTGPSTITNLKFTAVGTYTKVNAVNLYDGSNWLGSVSLSGATATFSNLSIFVAQDTTKTLTVKADFGAGVTDASSVYFEILDPATDVTYQEPNLSSTNPTAVSAVAGNAMYLFDGAATTFSLVRATATYAPDVTTTSTGYTNGVITLKVHSDGGTTTAPVAGDFTVLAYTNGTSVGAATAKSISNPVSSTITSIADGNDETININVSSPLSATGTGFVHFAVTGIKWYVTDGTLKSSSDGTEGAPTLAQTWGLTDFITPDAPAQ